VVTEADTRTPQQRSAGCLVGCLPLLVGVPLGFAVMLFLAEVIIQRS
jgi:hypothetical protein